MTIAQSASLDDARLIASADTSDRASGRRSRFGPLWLQVLVAVVIGIGIGVWFPNTGAALKPLGDSFVALIRMALAPIIFGTVVVGIARMGDLHEVGRVGAKALLYFEVVSTVSLVMGLVAINLLQPAAAWTLKPPVLQEQSQAMPVVERIVDRVDQRRFA